jgi:hypothetical protein
MQVESISSSMNSNTILIINNIPLNVSLIDNYQLREVRKHGSSPAYPSNHPSGFYD